jgi:tetratricopeptide (TPR) repeat protein
MKKTLAGLLFSLFMLVSVASLPSQDLRDPQFAELAQRGFADIFNLDYDKASQVFAALARDYPKHPAPPLYMACIHWLEEMLRRQDLSLNRFVAPTYFSGKTGDIMPASQRTEFFRHVEKCQELAKVILKKNPRDMDARYFLATAYGLRSSFAITIDHSLREAFSNGNKAYSACKKLIDENPNYYDAYMTVGIYEYIVGNIPWYLKWMLYVIGARGSVQDGLAHIKLAAERGQYIRNEAEMVLMVLNVREHRYAEALNIARHLNSQYPRSFLYALNVAQISQLMGRKDQALTALYQIEKRIELKEPNFHKYPLQSFRLNFGIDLLAMGRLDAAEDRFRKTLGDPQSQTREKALSHLYLGQLLDRKGRHKDAVKEYEIVLSLEDVENCHGRARQQLSQHR